MILAPAASSGSGSSSGGRPIKAPAHLNPNTTQSHWVQQKAEEVLEALDEYAAQRIARFATEQAVRILQRQRLIDTSKPVRTII